MEEKFIMAEGTALHICDSERGEKTIVLLHGYLETMWTWDALLPHIYEHARIVMLDLPGHGISQVCGDNHSMEWLAEVVAKMLKTLGIEQCTLVGHSMGGYVAAAFAKLYPEVANGVVMLCSTPNADSEQKRENREREIALIKAGKKELIARSAPQIGFAEGNRRRLGEAVTELQEGVLITEDEGIMALLRGMMDREDLNEMFRKSAVPQLFIFGEQDEHIPMEVSQSLAESHPQAKSLWFKESGHNPHIEEPEAVAAAILEFVNK